MNKIKSILLTGLAGILTLVSCDKTLDIDKLNFSVTTDKTTYKVGDTVVFKFNGKPDNITLFSGEDGHKYEFKSRTKAEGTPQLQFTSYSQFGLQTNTLQVLASTDFNGVVDSDILSGGWKPLPATLSTGADNTASGVVDLSQFIGEKPLYIAYRFIGTTGTTQKTWTIKNFLVQNKLKDGPVIDIANLSTAGFKTVSLKNATSAWVTANVGEIKITGGNASAVSKDDWIVTAPLYLDKVSADVGAALKNITTNLSSYPYVFTKPGVYKVTFVATNATADQSESTVKELTITVTP